MVHAALSQLELKDDFQIIGNPRVFEDYGVSLSQTLMVDGEIILEGYVPTLEEMISILKRPE